MIFDIIIHNGQRYKWVEDRTVCKGCPCKDRCEEVCGNKAGYMKRI